MTRRKQEHVLAGFAVGSGEPVTIPLAHTFVAGQTQLSGKSTLLEGLAVRSGRRALAFVTKRGESFSSARKIRPYLPREGKEQIPWRLVETILAHSLGEKKLKYERLWIIQASRGARSLDDVARNCERLHAKAKGNSKQAYELIGEYLDLVLPEMRELDAAETLELDNGLNVIDLVGHSQQLAAMVIRACLERINRHESEVLTIFPEAWEYAPRGRLTPASFEAQAMSRKGAVIGNFLLSDSQDVAGVDNVIRLSASVWFFGVQRELNELGRALKMIPAGVRKPRPEDVTRQKLGQFIACWGEHAIPMFALPAWMSEADGRAIARGEIAIEDVVPAAAVRAGDRDAARHVDRQRQAAHVALHAPNESQTEVVETLTEDDDMSAEDTKEIKDGINTLVQSMGQLVTALKPAHAAAPRNARARDDDPVPNGDGGTGGGVDVDQLYEEIKRRLQADAPRLLKVLAAVPEMEVTEQIKEIKTSTSGKGALMGRLAMLIVEGFMDKPTSSDAIREELKRYGLVAQKTYANVTFAQNMKQLVDWGFLFVEGGAYQANPRMKKHIKRTASRDEE